MKPALLLALAVLPLAACGGSSSSSNGAGLPPVSIDTTTPTAPPTRDAAGCFPANPPSPNVRTRRRPKAPLDPSKTYTVTLKTNCGTFSFTLDVKTSPKTAASFASLVRSGYFDGTVFHRIVPGFVIQGGDPSATGGGGPGYTTVDRPPRSARYTLGTVAMAKTPTQPAGTSGSQFFVVTAPNAGLPPDYAVLGKVVRGLPVVRRIGKLGDQGTEQPTETVEIEKATVATG